MKVGYRRYQLEPSATLPDGVLYRPMGRVRAIGLTGDASMRLGHCPRGVYSAATVFVLFALLGDRLPAQERIALEGHSEPVQSIAFSPDGSVLASGSGDATARLWDTASGRELAVLEHQGSVLQVAFRSDGQLLAARVSYTDAQETQTGEVIVWDVASRERRTTLRTGRSNDMAWSPDGRWIATIDRSVARLWNPATGEEAATLRDKDRLARLEFSPDGGTLAAVGSGRRPDHGVVALWNTSHWISGRFDQPIVLPGKGLNTNLAFSPDGRLLAVAAMFRKRGESGAAAQAEVRVLNVETGRQTGRFAGFRGTVAMAFSPDGRYLAASTTLPGGWAQTPGEVLQLCNVQSGGAVVLERETHAPAVHFSPRGAALATSHATPTAGVKLWDWAEGTVDTRLIHGGPGWVVTGALFSPRGDCLATTVLGGDPGHFLSLWRLSPTEAGTQ